MNSNYSEILQRFSPDPANAASKATHKIAGAEHTAQPQLCHISRSGAASKARLALDLMERGRPVVVLARSEAELTELRALLTIFDPTLAEKQQENIPAWERQLAVFTAHPVRHKGKGGLADRIAALYSLSASTVKCVLLVADTLLLRTPPVNIFKEHTLELRKGMDMPPELIVEQLVEWGYTRSPMVGEQGELAVRGDILDIFCPGYTRPVRLEFFGDTLDDLRMFDPSTQRSTGNLDELIILPAQPVLTTAAFRNAAQERWQGFAAEERIDEDTLYSLKKDLDAGGRSINPGMYYADSAFLEAWLPAGFTLILPGEVDTKELFDETTARWQDFLSDDTNGFIQPRSLVMRQPDEVMHWIDTKDKLIFDDLKVGVESHGVELAEREIKAFTDLFPRPADLERPWQRLVTAMQEWSRAAGKVILSFGSTRSRAKFLALAEQDGVYPKQRYSAKESGLFALVAPFRSGLNMVWDNTLVLGEGVLQPGAERTQRHSTEAFKGLDRYDELKEGDFLVHRDYGVCSFGGLQHIQAGGVANDFLLLRYSGDDKLYLPVDRLGLIQFFKAPDGISPALDKLGGSHWVASKDKARKAIEKIAEDLVEMYAYRKVAKGFRYGVLPEMYREFEATFGFEETPDQARAIEDVLADMQKLEPMDRLVCGDVGFGKTEVALRAAFRAALEGRQVALLCPTTVLAEQHYQTFRARLAGFPVNVGLLSRFVPKTKQTETLQATQRGQVDILIGTHRLLSKDVILPNLGLIILDEEQRFGVRHKELLKQMRKNVDVLTLTATPIPRTLQLSLSGIRELSVIETPPPERKPVSSALINRDDATLRTFLEREIGRAGQVFWVYNRVQGLDRAAEYVKKLVPNARVGMAHGQMNEKGLEDVMRRFWHGELDVLVCTAIVESGLDFPQANTLIVDQAQMFGLGQLYQLRGRVGRSDKQAYAVFVCQDVDRLPEITRKRMRVIMDMDYLGAGFQVAMEDLRLRGAGNILGESQSGHMHRVGLDLFLEMLEEAVAKMRGTPLKEVLETELNLGVAAHIPEKYIADSRERLRYYKGLSSAADAASQRDIEFELRDRFGTVPVELQNFFAVLNFKRHLADWGVSKADIYENRIRLTFSEKHARFDPLALVNWVQGNKDKAKITPPGILDIALEGQSLEADLALAYESLLPVMNVGNTTH